MKAIKKAYTHPTLRLYAPNGNLIKILSGNSVKNAYDIVKTSTKNDVSKLSFKCAYRSATQLLNYNSCEMTLKFGANEWYIIKNIKLIDENKREIEVSCESYFTVLKGIKCQPLNLIGQDVQSLFNAIIASPKNVNLVGKYKFKGTDIINTYRAVQTEDSVSVFENLLTLCQKFNAFMEFSFDALGQKWIFIRKVPQFNGKFIRKGKGLKSLNIEMDSSSIFTRMYGYGASDETTGNAITFMSINPTGKAYVEDISWFKALGMTDAQIYNNEQCLQECDYTDNNIVDTNELFRIIKEELAKVSVPKLSGTISMSDFSVYEDSSLTEPTTSEEIIFIDQDINFNIKCWIESIERRYSENPFDISVTISNTTKYDSILKDLKRSADATNGVTNIDTSGNPYVPESVIQDGSHINLTYKMGDMSTKITENANEISLTAENLNNAKAELTVRADEIEASVIDTANNLSSTITQTASQIRSEVSNADAGLQSQITQTASQIQSTVTDLNGAKSQITQLSNEISSKIDEGEFGSEIRQHSRDIQIAWNNISNYVQIDDTDGLILGNSGTGTYSKVGYDGRLSMMMAGETLPYHCLVAVGSKTITCTDDAYTEVSMSLPSKFSGLDDSEITVIVGVKKVYDTNIDNHSNLPFWFGCYASISDGKIWFEAMSKWRRVIYDSNDTSEWVADINGEYNGMIDVEYIIIA